MTQHSRGAAADARSRAANTRVGCVHSMPKDDAASAHSNECPAEPAELSRTTANSRRTATLLHAPHVQAALAVSAGNGVVLQMKVFEGSELIVSTVLLSER